MRNPIDRVFSAINTYEFLNVYLEIVDHALKGELTRLVLRAAESLRFISQVPPEPPTEPIRVTSERRPLRNPGDVP